MMTLLVQTAIGLIKYVELVPMVLHVVVVSVGQQLAHSAQEQCRKDANRLIAMASKVLMRQFHRALEGRIIWVKHVHVV